MKSLVTKIIGACLGLSLATGIGVSFAAGQKEMKQADAATTVTSTLTFTEKCGGKGTAADGASWNVSSDSYESSFDSTKGIHYGTGTAAVSYLKLESNSMVGTISKIVVNASGAKNTAAVLNVTVGGASFGSQKSLTNTATDCTLTGSAMGKIVVSITQTSTTKALYCKSIAVTYSSIVSDISSLSIEGNFNKTSYTYGEAWSRSGLTATGHLNNNTTVDLTSFVSWSYDPGCAKTDVTSLTATATINNISASHTEDVTVSKVSSPFVNGVPYKMFLTNTANNTNYYFIGEMGTGTQQYYGATTDDSSSTSIVNMYFEPSNDGQALYFYAGNDTSTAKKYIYISVNGTHVNFSFGTTVATFHYNGTTICTYVSSLDGIYGLGTYGTYSTFGTSASYMTSNYFAQFELVNALTAEDFANQFLDIVECDSTGASAPTYNYNYSWQALSDLFDQLDASEQNTLKTVDISGTDVVAQAMARYNLIVDKYGYTNFIGRTISNVSSRIMTANNNSEVTVIIIVVIALAMSSAVAFYVLKKKKFDR